MNYQRYRNRRFDLITLCSSRNRILVPCRFYRSVEFAGFPSEQTDSLSLSWRTTVRVQFWLQMLGCFRDPFSLSFGRYPCAENLPTKVVLMICQSSDHEQIRVGLLDGVCLTRVSRCRLLTNSISRTG